MDLTVPGASSRLTRIRLAYERYGWRASSILLYRTFFQWPGLRSWRVRSQLRALARCSIARSVRFGRHIRIDYPLGSLAIGENTTFMDRCVFVVTPNPVGRLVIGANCYFAPDVHLCADRDVRIGNDVRVGEFSSIRDSSHRYRDASIPINRQGDALGTIVIGDDVWIGRGCIIIGAEEGLTIGRGAVVGANSLVKESVPDYAIVVGAPARIVGRRESREHAAIVPPAEMLVRTGL